jgi:hypothetical protein
MLGAFEAPRGAFGRVDFTRTEVLAYLKQPQKKRLLGFFCPTLPKTGEAWSTLDYLICWDEQRVPFRNDR